MTTTTWTDGYGIWHAMVPRTGAAVAERTAAREAIRAELTERDAIKPGYRLRVKRHPLYDTPTHVSYIER